MPTALEITSRAIRYCCMHEGSITALGSVPISEDQDIIEAIKQAPLPENLGKVSLLMNHQDLLQQTMVQPPCPPEKLDRIVRFELLSLIPDPNTVLCSWQIAPIGEGNIRVLVNIAKRSLVEDVVSALKPHGGTLHSLSLPSAGLFSTWLQQHAQADSDSYELIVDCGGQNTHVAIAKGDQLVFTRSVKGGLDQIVEGLAELRGIDKSEARKLVARLGKGAPEDVHNLVKNAATGISTSLTSVLRFATAQLKIPPINATIIYLAGAGGQIPGFVEALSERSRMPVRIMNPFANTVSKLDLDSLDHLVALPSPWATVIGTVQNTALPLDVMEQVRVEKVAYWSTHGILRVAAISAAVLMVLAFGRQWMASGSATADAERLGNAENGLVPTAKKAELALQQTLQTKRADMDRVTYLQGLQAPGKISIEFLNAVAKNIDPTNRRVRLENYQLFRESSGVRILMTGVAQASGSNTLGDVLDGFRKDLRESYPPIQSITDLGSNIQNNSMTFQWELSLDYAGSAQSVDQPRRSSAGRGSRGGG